MLAQQSLHTVPFSRMIWFPKYVLPSISPQPAKLKYVAQGLIRRHAAAAVISKTPVKDAPETSTLWCG